MLTVLSLTGAGAACTTPQQSARLLFQRGATSLPPKLIWQAFDGQIAIEPGLESAELNVQLGVTLNEVMRPQSASSPLSLRLQSLILGCRSKPRPSCGCRTVIELVGSDQQTTLRGMEGIAVLTLARPADADALLRAAPSLVEHAIQAALEAPDQRPAAVSELEKSIRAGNGEQIADWMEQLKQPNTPEIRRINLWLAIGHVADRKSLRELELLQPTSEREKGVRLRALRWIRAASPGAGKSSPADVQSSSGEDGDRP